MFNSDQFCASLLSEPLCNSSNEQVWDDYRLMLICVLNTILDRYERNPDYHFIDSKLSLLTGKDFDDDDPIRGKRVIYPWIQGRGLEALAGHDIWLRNCNDIDEQVRMQLSRRIHVVLSEVLMQIEKLRNINGGRLFFMMTPTGTPLRLAGDGHVVPHKLPPVPPSNYSDLFYVKGMAAAASVLGHREILAEACRWFLQINNDIKENNFVSDQQQLDSRNVAVKLVQRRYSHGPRMIGVGAASRLLKCTKDVSFREIGFEYLDHILHYHINLGGDNKITKKYDMWEVVDADGHPYIDDEGTMLSDPGHACEFVGLALDFMRASESYTVLNYSQKEILKEYKRILPHVLERNFANGFSAKGLGICKSVDLISRKVINSDMPWWSLPETMRAALAACHIVPPEDSLSFAQIAIKCSNAFVSHYIKSNLNLMAVQTLTEDGKCADVIPATPDADPGYHTGLSIIDCLELYRGLNCKV
jgi:hypothetical protein